MSRKMARAGVHHEGKKEHEVRSRVRGLPANHANIANEETMVWGFLACVGVTTKYSKGTKTGRDEDLGARGFLEKTLSRKGGKIAKGEWDDC